MNPFFEQVYAVVKRIPLGSVMTYSQIARHLGNPRAARQVGWAMRCCPEHLPWQRVVMADGSITGGMYADIRKSLLETEGVIFLPDGRVDMASCQWRPTVHRAFPPLCDDEPRVLILGTFPSPMSREKGEYYGNPRNQFWKVIFGAFGIPFDEPDYAKKKAVLSAGGISLWDVINECEVDGALDSAICNPVYNTDLPDFIKGRGIQKVYFNGGNAFTFYKRGIGPVERNVLPSTSPAHASMRYEEKLRLWREALLGMNN